MSALGKALVAVISSGASWVAPHIDELRLAGARVRVCAPDRALWSILTALDYEAIVIADVESGVNALARALGQDAKLRTVPSVVLRAPGTTRGADVDLPSLDGDDAHGTVVAVEALIDASLVRRSGTSLSVSSMKVRIDSVPPPATPARRELEAGFHDLRALLGVVVGYGSNLRDGSVGALSEAQRDQVLKMIETVADATVLLEQMMTATRTAALGVPAARRRGPQRTLVDLTSLSRAVVRIFGKSAEQRGIELIAAPAEPISVWGNAVHLKQVLANLVVNALKFAPPGGRVRVATRMATAGAHAELVVSDNGPGVPPADRERIFNHSVRLERDEGVDGTGIGLAVVRELVVVHHGGTVRVTDAEGGGAEFIVSLPLDRRAEVREKGPGGPATLVQPKDTP